MKVNNNKGFTLIEMLVVIGMIGVLAAAVLTALGPARLKARDSRVISDLNQLSAIIEANYNSSNNTYPANKAAVQALTGASSIDTDISTNMSSSWNYNVNAGPTAYAAYVQLISNTAQYYCIDSTGKKSTGSAPGGTTCP